MPCNVEGVAGDRGCAIERCAAHPVGALAAYVATFALLSLPWLVAACDAIPIRSPDARADTRLLTWILWWVASALTGDAGPILDAPINHPASQQLTGSEHFAALQAIFLPAYLASRNPVLAMNALLFLSFHDGAQAVVSISAQPSPLRTRRSSNDLGSAIDEVGQPPGLSILPFVLGSATAAGRHTLPCGRPGRPIYPRASP